MSEKQTFWLDEWGGTARGGYRLRNPLKEFFERLEAKGVKPVGIVYDGSYNLEIIVEATEGVETFLTRMFKVIKQQRELIDRQSELVAKLLHAEPCTPIKSQDKEK